MKNPTTLTTAEPITTGPTWAYVRMRVQPSQGIDRVRISIHHFAPDPDDGDNG
jgi:hypothetical protein